MSFQENLSRVEESIAAACRHAGRPRSEVELMAVSKTHPVECLLEAANAGLTLFGENRVQEFQEKSSALHESGYAVALEGLPGDAPAPGSPKHPALHVHLIGHLQSNKAAKAAEIFSAIDTLDSLRLAERLNEAASRLHRTIEVLLEIKLSHEESKEGLAPEDEELARLLERLPDLDHLVPRGLMTIAPISEDPEVARACFCRLRDLRNKLSQQHPRLSLETLSMGMSGDYAAAIEEGSTQIRIGTALFGARPRPA